MNSNFLAPRLVIAGTHSGVGKTTVATGLMAAYRQRGVAVASAKVGPDFIDPGYHSVATGLAPRNLDAWLCGAQSMAPLAARAGREAELLIVEGVMGLFDGAVDGSPSSTADIACLIDAPVVLVVDGSAMSASIAALVRGYRDHQPELNLAGVILNRVSSPHHRSLLVEALECIGVEVLGTVGKNDALSWRDRHLGLIPVEEQTSTVTASINQLGTTIAQSCDLVRLEVIARRARVREVPMQPGPDRVGEARVAVAAGAAFSFQYRDNLEALEKAGAELVAFDPLVDEHLPFDIDGLIIGGGFPEVFGARLAENRRLLAEVSSQVSSGLITWAECGGLLWLTNSLDAMPMAAVVAARAAMSKRLTLGYRTATALCDNPLMQSGDEVRGHEFHYSQTEPGGDALLLSSRFGSRQEGFASATLLATYLHQHLGSRPELAERFMRVCVQRRLARENA
ncbi:cobyrinate a,c-diamide synthase [Granulosicoccus sp. 3-233]|uniref:cobyrinate a,c-diamide synthase n=1 Tax=Granulosicoccus sp. 3-233 TaxID=3417969 RepID=UPI003D358185